MASDYAARRVGRRREIPVQTRDRRVFQVGNPRDGYGVHNTGQPVHREDRPSCGLFPYSSPEGIHAMRNLILQMQVSVEAMWDAPTRGRAGRSGTGGQNALGMNR